MTSLLLLVVAMVLLGCIVVVDGCTNASQGNACACSLEENLHGNTVTRAATGNFSKSSGNIRVPTVIPPNFVSRPGILQSHAVQHSVSVLQLWCMCPNSVVFPVRDRGHGPASQILRDEHFSCRSESSNKSL